MEKKIGIYTITNIVNSNKYIGLSCNIQHRWDEHNRLLRLGYHENKHLQNAWNKYGGENFVFEIVEECDRDLLVEKEVFWGKELEKQGIELYNEVELGGLPPSQKGRKYPEHSAFMKGRYAGEKNYFYGKSFKKDDNHMFLKTPSPEVREKLSKINKGKKLAPETIEKMKGGTGLPKLDMEKARQIRRIRYEERKTLTELGEMFGVAIQTVSNILHNKSWIEGDKNE